MALMPSILRSWWHSAVLPGHLGGLVEDEKTIIAGVRVGEQDVTVGGIQSHALHR